MIFQSFNSLDSDKKKKDKVNHNLIEKWELKIEIRKNKIENCEFDEMRLEKKKKYYC